MAVPGAGRVLGVDLGTKRVGVAVCDGGQRLATGVAVIQRDGRRHEILGTLRDLVAEWEAVGVVVGLPLSLSGAVGPSAARALEEIEQLREGLAVAVDSVDERMTTMTAASALQAGGRGGRRQRRVVDQVAAAVLLQSWLDRRRSSEGGLE